MDVLLTLIIGILTVFLGGIVGLVGMAVILTWPYVPRMLLFSREKKSRELLWSFLTPHQREEYDEVGSFTVNRCWRIGPGDDLYVSYNGRGKWHFICVHPAAFVTFADAQLGLLLAIRAGRKIPGA